MGLLQLVVRDRNGNPLSQFCDDVLDQNLPVDHARLAQSYLQMIRSSDGAAVHSVHFLRDGREIGSWSVDREALEAMAATARQLDQPKLDRPKPRPRLRLVHSNCR